MIKRLHKAYGHWLLELNRSTTKREFLYRCGRLDDVLDMLGSYYGFDSLEYKALRKTVHNVELKTAQRLGLSYPDDEQ